MPSPRWIGFIIGIIFFDWRGAIVGYILGWVLESLFQFKVHVHFSHSNSTTPPVYEDALTDAYRILGIPASATEEELRKAYKNLAVRYHPDRHAHLSEKERHEAERMFKIINDSKERIWKVRGM